MGIPKRATAAAGGRVGDRGGTRRGRAAALGVAAACGVLMFAPAQGTTAGEYLSTVPGADIVLGSPEVHAGPGIAPHEPGQGGCSCPACCGARIDGIPVSASKAPGGADPSSAGEYVVAGG